MDWKDWEIKQIKFTNGDEVLCQPGPYDDEDGFTEQVIYHALVVDMIFPEISESEEFTLSYAMRPWMLQQNDFSIPISIRPEHKVAEYEPEDYVQNQYLSTIIDIYKKMKEMVDSDGFDSDGPVIGPTTVVQFPKKS